MCGIILVPKFWVVPTSLYVWLDFGIEVLTKMLRRREHTDFEIRWPSSEETKVYAGPLKENRRNGPLMD